jgi:hypothetical protein
LSKITRERCSPEIVFFTPGGDDRIRTGDPLLAKQVLSQLSYIPAATGGPSWDRTRDLALIKRAL